MNSELKPCPFCGHKAKLGIQFALLPPMQEYIISCSYCGASTIYFLTKQAAIKSWNIYAEAQ